MQKVVAILIFSLSLINCSVLKRKENVSITIDKQYSTSINNIVRQNLSTFNFSLNRVEITVVGSEKKQKLLSNIKYLIPGKFLISIRNNTGIEAIRIYIDKDTILANDRINRKMYYGSSIHLFEKYGISTEYLPILFGDLISKGSKQNEDIKCRNGIAEIINFVGQNEIKYSADCAKNKIMNARLRTDTDKEQIILEFSNFNKINNNLYPSIIKINDSKNNNKINIKISKAEAYTGQNLRFIPGNNYELILLQ